MPLISSSFSPPRHLRSPFIQTVLPSVARHLSHPLSRQENLELPDGDVLELEWHGSGHHQIAIINHGLEGSTRSTYVTGLIQTLLASGIGVVAWNMRGCGPSRNRLPSWYHSGSSDDLRSIIRHVSERHDGEIALIGISVGGNILLKYLGEEGAHISSAIKRSIAISVPMDLKGSAESLARPSRWLYMQYLLRPLRARIRDKHRQFPRMFDIQGLRSIRTFHEFDSRYTAPMHGFSSVEEYWERCSSRHFLSGISIPTLIVSAKDDPFLSPGCFPYETARSSDTIFLETPEHGGHVGFIDSLRMTSTWLDRRVAGFLLNSRH